MQVFEGDPTAFTVGVVVIKETRLAVSGLMVAFKMAVRLNAATVTWAAFDATAVRFANHTERTLVPVVIVFVRLPAEPPSVEVWNVEVLRDELPA